MKISIFGLGYVGAVSLACLARDGHEVIGVDVDPSKLDMISDGKTPVVEEGMIDLMKSVVSCGRVSVTQDVSAAVAGSEISLICVGTPSAVNGSQDQSAIVRLCHDMGRALAGKSGRHIFVFRSTVVPGTVEEVLTPILEDKSGKVSGRDFDACFQPEFLREGSSIKDYDNPPFTIVGTDSEYAADVLRRLFGHLPCAFHKTSIRTAEMVKYCCNNFHALKIAFANETARLCEALKVDPFEVMDLVCQDRQLNISPAYLKPGFAFGGSCLPKDLRATSYLAKKHDVELPMLNAILPSNRLHIDHAITKILASGKRRIGMIGLSFKSGTDDLRESPLVYLAEQLIGKGMNLLIFDGDVHLSRLLGANRRFIEQHLPHIGCLLRSEIEEVVSWSEYIVIGTNQAAVLERLQELLDGNRTVLDVVGVSDLLSVRHEGLAWGYSRGTGNTGSKTG